MNPISQSRMVGIITTLLGVGWYSYLKFQEQTAPKHDHKGLSDDDHKYKGNSTSSLCMSRRLTPSFEGLEHRLNILEEKVMELERQRK